MNSLKAICPATVDILMRVLQGTADQYSSSDGTDHVQRLTSLILRCLVTTIHAIHRATPEEVCLSYGSVEDFFYILGSILVLKVLPPNFLLPISELIETKPYLNLLVVSPLVC